MLSLDDEHPDEMVKPLVLRHPTDRTKYRTLQPSGVSKVTPLLVEILREGSLVYSLPSIEEIRQLRDEDLNALDPGVRRLINPHVYHVSLTEQLWNLKQELIESAKSRGRSEG